MGTDFREELIINIQECKKASFTKKQNCSKYTYFLIGCTPVGSSNSLMYHVRSYSVQMTELLIPQTREYIDWKRPLSCKHSAMMVFSTQLAEDGGGGVLAHSL
jgi:hypothetical protein